MIRRFKIKGFALIDELEFFPGRGLNIITGETGAGKSIIIEALNICMGERASSDLVRQGKKRAVIEVEFDYQELTQTLAEETSRKLKTLIQEYELSDEPILLMRREITSSGRSRAYLNDSPAPLTLFKQVGDLIVDIHGQHEHQSLMNSENHIQYLDSYGNYADVLSNYQRLYQTYYQKSKNLQDLKDRDSIVKEKSELYRYQLQEIEPYLELVDRYQEFQGELKRLQYAGQLQSGTQQLADRFYSSERSFYNELQESVRLLDELAALDSRLKEFRNRLESALYDFQDIGQELERYSAGVIFDPRRFEELNERFYQLQRLIKKYGGSLESLKEKRKEMESFLEQHQDFNQQIRREEEALELLRKELSQSAVELHQLRSKAARRFSDQMNKVLQELDFRQAEFEVKVEPVEDKQGMVEIDGVHYGAGVNGIDRVEFWISTNPGEELKPLNRVASGGEISRIMLGIKSLLSGKEGIPVVVFDEIDAGISGKTADLVGKKLQEIAGYHQILCITHLPQIASRGDHHFLVEKQMMDGRMVTVVKEVTGEERIKAIAALVSGKGIEDSSYRYARELLKEAGR